MNPNRTVLHVDRDPHTLRVVAKYLGQRNYRVVSLTDPARALDQLLESTCRVVLLSIDAHGADGLDLLREIKRQDGAIQVIVVTESVSVTTALESMRLGAEACLCKPLSDMEALDSAVNRAFETIDRWWMTVAELSQRKRVPHRTDAARESSVDGRPGRALLG